MLVYVISKDGQLLMPTSRCGWVRWALKSGKATVINRCPFTELINKCQQMTLEITQLQNDIVTKINEFAF